jgi:hypothetical protein
MLLYLIVSEGSFHTNNKLHFIVVTYVTAGIFIIAALAAVEFF